MKGLVGDIFMHTCKWIHSCSTKRPHRHRHTCAHARGTGASLECWRNCDPFLQGISREQGLGGRPTWQWDGKVQEPPPPPPGRPGAPPPPLVVEGACSCSIAAQDGGQRETAASSAWCPRERSLSSQGRHVSPSARNLSQWAMQAGARSTSYLAPTKPVLFLDHVIGPWVEAGPGQLAGPQAPLHPRPPPWRSGQHPKVASLHQDSGNSAS